MEKFKLYLQLMRVDKPIGFYLLMWPVVWAFLISTSGSPNIFYVIIFFVGIVITRSAGCVINDYFDQDFDRRVERTKDRVLANNQITNQEALVLFLILISLCFLLLVMLDFKIIFYAIFSFLLIVSYPLMKRFFKVPQLILGIAFGSSIPMVFILEKGEITYDCILLYLATILWAVAYDTYYAMADKKDDLKIGVKSSAVFFGEQDYIYAFYIQLIVIAIFLIIGITNSFSTVFYLSLFVSLLFILYQRGLAKHRIPFQCISAFENNNLFGLTITFGLIFNYIFIS